MQERLQKIIAQAGICSRRAAEQKITERRVTVNGRVVGLGDKADPKRDRICLDGRQLNTAEQKVYLMLYKPRGYVTTLKDEKGRRDISQLIRGCGARVYPIGRLDYDSEGLLLLTNDGDLAQSLAHPSHEVDKQYLVSVRGDLKNLQYLTEPMTIDGYQIRPASLEVLRQEEGRAQIRLTIHEGRNRQIRKMCQQCGLEVRRLKREAMGELRLDASLLAGRWRELRPEEIEYLQTL